MRRAYSTFRCLSKFWTPIQLQPYHRNSLYNFAPFPSFYSQQQIKNATIMKDSHTLSTVIHCLDSWLKTTENSESWDNTGLLLGSGKFSSNEKLINSVLLCIDLTPPVLEDAIERKIDLIIAYHPPLFRPVNRLAYNSWKETVLTGCIANDICVYSPHTALDSVLGGINDSIVASLDKVCMPVEVSPIIPKDSSTLHGVRFQGELDSVSALLSRVMKLVMQSAPLTYGLNVENIVRGVSDQIELHVFPKPVIELYTKDALISLQSEIRGIQHHDSTFVEGSGRKVKFPHPVNLRYIIEEIKTLFGVEKLQVAYGNRFDLTKVKTVAICAGSGFSLVKNADCDLMITGEMSHHEILEIIHENKAVILCGHDCSERHYLKRLEVILKILLSADYNLPNILSSSSDTKLLKLV